MRILSLSLFIYLSYLLIEAFLDIFKKIARKFPLFLLNRTLLILIVYFFEISRPRDLRRDLPRDLPSALPALTCPNPTRSNAS